MHPIASSSVAYLVNNSKSSLPELHIRVEFPSCDPKVVVSIECRLDMLFREL